MEQMHLPFEFFSSGLLENGALLTTTSSVQFGQCAIEFYGD